MSARPSRKATINGIVIDLSQLEVQEVDPAVFKRVFKRPGGELNLLPGSSGWRGRFDDPSVPSTFETTYMADSAVTGAFEVRAIRQPMSDGKLHVRRDFHFEAKVARYESDRKLLILPLREQNANRLNIVDILREPGYNHCRQLSKEIHDAFPEIDGLEYTSRMYAPRPCWAIYTRGAVAARLRAHIIGALAADLEYANELDKGRLILMPSDI